MFRIVLGLILTLSFAFPLSSQEIIHAKAPDKIVQEDKVKLKTPNSEVEDVIKFLVGDYFEEIDKQYIRFLSTYALPTEEKRNNAVLTCSFVLHSLIGPSKNFETNNSGGYYPLAKMENGKFVALQRVPFSNTLWWIDLRDYNFTIEAWEKAASIDGYFVTPIVQEQNNGALRLIAGNAILRMDWFNNHVTDTTRQIDLDSKFDLYSTFLFAQVTPPKNINEWQKYFALDIKRSRDLGNESAALVTKSKAVARHNRMLFHYRTELGYMYDTYDVKNQQGLRDYYESFFENPNPGTPPQVSDAGEIFGTNQVGMQIYALRDGNFNLISFGDPTVVRHLTDILGDVRVRIAHSCIDCHAAGPLPSENTQAESLRARLGQYTYKKEDANRIKRVFLDNRFEDSIEENKALFAKALERVNGLTPEENGKLFVECIADYSKDITIERAAFECGVPIEEFKEKILQGKFGGRVKLLVQNNEPIPIDVWETRGKDGIPGQFQQAMILINGLTKITKEVTVEKEIPKDIPVNSLLEDAYLMSGSNKLMMVPKGTVIEVLEKRPNWVRTTYNSQNGWIEEKKIKFAP